METLKDSLNKISDALALMNSMILSAERHSDQSTKMFYEAEKAISELSRLKDEREPESNELYPCLYSIAVRCTMVDPCLGCETWAKYKAGEEISRLKSEGEDKLTCTDKCRWFNIGYGHCNFCIRQVKEHDCRDNFEPAFDSERNPLNGGSYYFAVSSPVVKMWFDDCDGRWHISSRTNIKNYDNDIEKFLEWIKPYIDGGSGEREMYAIVLYEEASEPAIYYLYDE